MLRTGCFESLVSFLGRLSIAFLGLYELGANKIQQELILLHGHSKGLSMRCPVCQISNIVCTCKQGSFGAVIHLDLPLVAVH